jgi:hypothetical protein
MMQRLLATINASHKMMMARMDAWLTDMKNIRKETMTCQEKTMARLAGKEQPTSVEMKPEVTHEEVPVEDATVMPVGEPRNRSRDRRNLAAERRQKNQQKRNQSKNGCRKNLVTAHRGTTRSAQVAQRMATLLTKETRRYYGSQKRMIVVYRKMSRHATVAWLKRHIIRKNWTRSKV